jgi:outer membrane receptor protein involved in Fe transport
MRRLELYGVIDNLLNKNPPDASYGALMGMGTGGTGGYDPYDNSGRYYKMGLRCAF